MGNYTASSRLLGNPTQLGHGPTRRGREDQSWLRVAGEGAGIGFGD